MSDEFTIRNTSHDRRVVAAGILAATLCGAAPALGGNFVEPQVFASTNGVLDLLMIATPMPIPSIMYFPPTMARGAASTVINPIGWVYQICHRTLLGPPTTCPAGVPTVSDYGGVRLALQKGDSLKIRLVNRLPPLNPIKVNHSKDPGGGNLILNLTNLHTHGLIVPARAPTLSDPTFGDYVFVDIYNSANGTPVPQTTHQHGSIVKDYADYRIDIPANHPSGAYWFHPHLHGIAMNQVSEGLAGIISIGSAGDYASGDISGAPLPAANVRHLILKDLQVLAASNAQAFANGTAPVVNGEVLNQQDPAFCAQFSEGELRQGSCPGLALGGTFFQGGDYAGGQWYYTINGQQYPNIRITSPDGELWRLTNASASTTYDLLLSNDATQTPMTMQLVSVDGVSIDVPPPTNLGTITKLGGARFKVVACPPQSSVGMNSTPVCVSQFAMMPSSRAEVWVTYRDESGNVVTPPAGATATFRNIGISTGPAGDSLPEVDLATVQFAQTGQPSIVAKALNVHGDALAANRPGGIFSAQVSGAPTTRSPGGFGARAPVAAVARPTGVGGLAPGGRTTSLPTGCQTLAPGHHRRIFFGLQDPTGSPSVFGQGYEEVDQNGVVVPGTQIDLTSFDPSVTTVCLPLGPGQTPVHETWELVNLATENHNFHMHQTKFRVVDPSASSGTPMSPTLDPSVGAGIMEDNVPLPVAIATTLNIGTMQHGYCLIAQWRDGTCTMTPVVVDIPFSQLGEFVYHCHILAHEDGGMMAKIQVVAAE